MEKGDLVSASKLGDPRVEYTVIYCKTFVDWKLQRKEMEPVCVKIPCSSTEEMVLSLVYFQLSPG